MPQNLFDKALRRVTGSAPKSGAFFVRLFARRLHLVDGGRGVWLDVGQRSPSPRCSVGAGRRDLLSGVRRARPRVKTSQQDGENAC